MTARPTGAGAQPTRWGIVLLVFAAGAIATMQIGKVPPALPALRADLGLDLVDAGWVASLITLTGALVGIATGIVADRVGHRRIVAAGLVCLVAGTLWGSATQSLGAILATRFLEGVGYVAIVVAGTPIIAGVTAERHLRAAMGLWSAYFPVGIGVMVIVSPVFLERFGWREMWLANGALVAAFLVLFLAVTRDLTAGVAADRRLAWSDVRLVVARPGPWLLAASFMLLSVGVFSIMTWLPTYLIDTLGLAPATAALLTAAFVFLFIPSNIAGGWLLALPGVRRWHVLAVGSVGLAILPLGMLGSGVPDWLRIVCAVLVTQIPGLIPGAVFAGMPAHAPSPRQIGAVAGVLMQGNSVGVLVGPPALAALAVALGGFGASAYAMLAVGALSFAVALAVRAVEGRPPETSFSRR